MNCEEAVKVKTGQTSADGWAYDGSETTWTSPTLYYATSTGRTGMGSSKTLTSTTTGWEDFYTNYSELDCPIDPTSCRFLGTGNSGNPTTCGAGSDSSTVPGTTESCGSTPNQIVKFEAGSNPLIDTQIVASRTVPGYVFEDTIKCQWKKASDPTFIYNNGVNGPRDASGALTEIQLTFKVEQVRDCSSHIVQAAEFDATVMSVSATLAGRSWSSVYGTLPQPQKFNRYWYQ